MHSLGYGVFGQGDSLSASGRILAQDNRQLVNIGRIADGSSLEVRFPLGGAYDLPGLHPAIKDTPDLVTARVLAMASPLLRTCLGSGSPEFLALQGRKLATPPLSTQSLALLYGGGLPRAIECSFFRPIEPHY
jgi:hypothetical protein